MPELNSDRPTGFGPHASASGDASATAQDRSSRSTERSTLPLRDWILLPLVAVITLGVLGGAMRFIADREIGERKSLANSSCIQDLGAALHGVPNSVCTINYSRGHSVEFKFNSCGDRTLIECGPKPDGVYRIVVIGASNPMGFGVPVDKTLAAQLSIDLARQTGRRVEVYDAALLGSGGVPETLAKRMPEFLALHPDLILWVFGAWDVSFRGGDEGEAPAASFGKRSPLDSFGNSRAGFFLRNFLFQSESIYMTAYLKRTETIARANAIANNSEPDRYRTFSQNLGKVADQAKAAGVPVAAAFLPIRGESASLMMSPRPAGVDIDQLIQSVRLIMAEKGVVYLDVMPQLLGVPALDRLYDHIGDHINAHGHAVYAQILADTLTSGAVPSLYPGDQERIEEKQHGSK